jgi:hypothetical protein
VKFCAEAGSATRIANEKSLTIDWEGYIYKYIVVQQTLLWGNSAS